MEESDENALLGLMEGPEDSILEISALSRPLVLGMFYNARKDQLIPGFRLWNIEDINSKTIVSPQPSSRLQVEASESLQKKTSLLDVTTSVKLSFYSGLLEAGGSAKYLSEKISSRQCRVTLKYHVTTEFKELVISELKIPKPEVFNMTDATHVVSGVLYGADALMEFQETAWEASNKQEIKENLHGMIKKIPTIEISGDGSLKMDDEDKEKVKKLSCKFFGDFHLEKIPSTYEDAVKVYKKLPNLLGEKGEKAVPMKVWLYPLSKLSNTESKLKKMISDVLVSEVETVMDVFHQAEGKTNDLLGMSKRIKTEDITTKLEQFQSSLRVFTTEFLWKMYNLIPAIRKGTVKETALRDLMKSQAASGFSEEELKQWLDGKETEIIIVTEYINKVHDYEIKAPGPELVSFLMDMDVTDAFVFSFTSLSYEEPYLKKISQAAENFSNGFSSSTPEQEQREEDPWYKRPGVKEVLDYSLSVFNKAPKNKVISFISDPEHPGASVRQYHQATLKDPHVTNPFQQYACKLTLDPDTAFYAFLLSEENRKVTHVNRNLHHPHLPERFTYYGQVLSKEPLTGRCYFEYEWSGGANCVAVAYKSIDRNGSDSFFGYNDKAWMMFVSENGYSASHNKTVTPIPTPPSGSRRVGVYLGHDGGTLSFYSVSSDTLTHLHTFNIPVSSEPLYAGFTLYEYTSVTLY